MDLLNMRRRWVVHKIMTYLKKYLTSFSYENIQVFGLAEKHGKIYNYN